MKTKTIIRIILLILFGLYFLGVKFIPLAEALNNREFTFAMGYLAVDVFIVLLIFIFTKEQKMEVSKEQKEIDEAGAYSFFKKKK